MSSDFISEPRYLVSGPVKLDLEDERLWRDEKPVKLGGKAFLVLKTLISRPGVMITKDAFFELVWTDAARQRIFARIKDFRKFSKFSWEGLVCQINA